MILLTDEDYDVPIAKKLSDRGLDVLMLRDLNLINQGFEDVEVLMTATKLGRTVGTFNRNDFKALHREFPDHAGIIICKRNTPVTMLVDKIVSLVESTPDARGQLFRITQG